MCEENRDDGIIIRPTMADKQRVVILFIVRKIMVSDGLSLLRQLPGPKGCPSTDYHSSFFILHSSFFPQNPFSA
jgi:hypothetical protein